MNRKLRGLYKSMFDRAGYGVALSYLGFGLREAYSSVSVLDPLSAVNAGLLLAGAYTFGELTYRHQKRKR